MTKWLIEEDGGFFVFVSTKPTYATSYAIKYVTKDGEYKRTPAFNSGYHIEFLESVRADSYIELIPVNYKRKPVNWFTRKLAMQKVGVCFVVAHDCMKPHYEASLPNPAEQMQEITIKGKILELIVKEGNNLKIQIRTMGKSYVYQTVIIEVEGSEIARAVVSGGENTKFELKGGLAFNENSVITIKAPSDAIIGFQSHSPS